MHDLFKVSFSLNDDGSCCFKLLKSMCIYPDPLEKYFWDQRFLIEVAKCSFSTSGESDEIVFQLSLLHCMAVHSLMVRIDRAGFCVWSADLWAFSTYIVLCSCFHLILSLQTLSSCWASWSSFTSLLEQMDRQKLCLAAGSSTALEMQGRCEAMVILSHTRACESMGDDVHCCYRDCFFSLNPANANSKLK